MKQFFNSFVFYLGVLMTIIALMMVEFSFITLIMLVAGIALIILPLYGKSDEEINKITGADSLNKALKTNDFTEE